jgi:hypothetical protein
MPRPPPDHRAPTPRRSTTRVRPASAPGRPGT